MFDDGRDDMQTKVLNDKMTARDTLLNFQRFNLKRKVFFIHGWGDQGNVCWTHPYTDQDTIKDWIDSLVINKDEMVFYIKLLTDESNLKIEKDGTTDIDNDDTFYFENFFQFANLLQYKIKCDRVDGEQIDLICHSMGGLDSVAAIAVDKETDTTETIYYPGLQGVNRLITVSTPHQGAPGAKLANTEVAKLLLHESEYIATQGSNMDIKSAYMKIVNNVDVRNRLLERVSWLHMFGGGDDIVVPKYSYKIKTEGLSKSNYTIYSALELARHSQVMGITQDVRMALEIIKLLAQ